MPEKERRYCELSKRDVKSMVKVYDIQIFEIEMRIV